VEKGRAVIGYIDGKPVIEMAGELGVVRSAINRWLGWYEAEGANGLRTRKSPGAAPKLDERQRAALADLIEVRHSGRANPLEASVDPALASLRCLSVVANDFATSPSGTRHSVVGHQPQLLVSGSVSGSVIGIRYGVRPRIRLRDRLRLGGWLSACGLG
jgi:hypothetical protein